MFYIGQKVQVRHLLKQQDSEHAFDVRQQKP